MSVFNNNNVFCRTWIVTCPFTQTFSLFVETSQRMSFARVHSVKLTCIQTSSIVCHHLPHSVLHVITPLRSSKSDMLTKQKLSSCFDGSAKTVSKTQIVTLIINLTRLYEASAGHARRRLVWLASSERPRQHKI